MYQYLCSNNKAIMAWLFTEYDVARNSQVLHWSFSILRATSYSVNSQATLQRVLNLNRIIFENRELSSPGARFTKLFMTELIHKT